MKKRAVLLAGIMIFLSAGMAQQSYAADSVDEDHGSITESGTDGDLSWSLYEDGFLLIEGEGDYEGISYESYENLPQWCQYGDEIKSARVEVSGITSARKMFCECENLESIDLSNLDTSLVTDMAKMFDGCESLESIDVSCLDTSSVTDMHYMFAWCSALTSLDITSFDISNVTDMAHMFFDCKALKSVALTGLDTSSVTDMKEMFEWCDSLETVDLSGLDLSSVTTMHGMFDDCKELKTVDFTGVDTPALTDMSEMFAYSGVTSLDLSDFDTSHVTDMSEMFSCCDQLESVDVSHFDTSSVTTMESMFNDCEVLSDLDTSSFKTPSLCEMDSIFMDCKNVKTLDLSGFDTSNVTSMNGLFYGCSSLESLDLGSFDTSSVKKTNRMFCDCKQLESLDLTGFDLSQDKVFTHMFDGCVSLQTLDLEGVSTPKAVDMSWMFWNCKSLTELDLSGFYLGNIGSASFCDDYEDELYKGSLNAMFSGCSDLTSIGLSTFKMADDTDVSRLFYGCSNLSGSFTFRSSISGYEGCFKDAAVENGARIIISYGGGCTCEMAEGMAGTKSETSDVVFIGIPSWKSIKNARDGILISWNKVPEAEGYYYKCISENEDGSQSVRTCKVKGSSVTSVTDADACENGTLYKYKLYAYRTDNGKTVKSVPYTYKLYMYLSPSDITYIKSRSSGSVTLKWQKNTACSGYQIQISKDKTFEGAVKKVTVKDASVIKTEITGRTKGATYYVRVRGYKTENGKNYYSAWSSVKSVKIHK